MHKTIPISLLFLGLFAACTKRTGVEPTIHKGNDIRWDIIAPTGGSTKSSAKSLINSYTDLQYACTPIEEGGQGKAIGLFAECESHGVKTYDIFGSRFTRLLYKTKLGSPYHWNYERFDELGNEMEDLEWIKTKLYHIRAYYPHSLTSSIEPSSTPRSLVLNYNTHTTQEDLMVAYNRVYTVDTLTGNPSICIAKDPITGDRIDANLTKSDGYTMVDGRKRYDWCGYDQPFDLGQPIPLFFDHTLAAIRVRFKFNYDVSGSGELDVSDELLNCYFSNADDYNGLHTTGSLVYGNNTNTVGNSREQLEGWWKTFIWLSIQSSMADVPYYRWGLSEEDIAAGTLTGTTLSRYSRIEGGERKVSDHMAVAYTKYPTQDRNEFVRTGAADDEDNGTESMYVDEGAGPITMSLKQEAPYFNENDGWLFIIPQKARTGLKFNFTTRRMGLVSTLVPPVTYTTDDDGDQAYLPGYRYIYTLTIEKSNIQLGLSIVPWNDIYASEDIVF